MASIPRYFFGAMPPTETAAQIGTRLKDADIEAKLGARMFPLELMHQSLSGRHLNPDAATIARLLHAGSRIQAHAVTLRFNRIKWSHLEPGGKSHCALLAQGRAPLFDALLDATQDALDLVDLGDDEGHTPHMTTSYNAGEVQPTIWIMPVEWTIDEVLLLKGHGDPYRYEVIGRWPLLPPVSPQHRDDLFAVG